MIQNILYKILNIVVYKSIRVVGCQVFIRVFVPTGKDITHPISPSVPCGKPLMPCFPPPGGGEGAVSPVCSPSSHPAGRVLRDSCAEMESRLVAKTLKAIRRTVHRGEMFHGGLAGDIVEDVLVDEYVIDIPRYSSSGIAKILNIQSSVRLHFIRNCDFRPG